MVAAFITRRTILAGVLGAAGLAACAGPLALASAAPPVELVPPDRPDLAIRPRTRSEWGAEESLRFGQQGEVWPPAFTRVQNITVHHSAIPVTSDRTAAIREIYRTHAITNHWGDIGYHLVIDPEGVLYQGRHTGGIAVFDRMPGKKSVPQVVTAGHVRGHNPGNIGICLLGDFTRARPEFPAVASLIRTIAALCLIAKLNPLARLHYVNPDNSNQLEGPVVGRHRDWVATQCPGELFAADFETVRQQVAKQITG